MITTSLLKSNLHTVALRQPPPGFASRLAIDRNAVVIEQASDMSPRSPREFLHKAVDPTIDHRRRFVHDGLTSHKGHDAFLGTRIYFGTSGCESVMMYLGHEACQLGSQINGVIRGTPWDIPPKCERCGALEADCQCPPAPPPRMPPESQTARVAVEKRSKGKKVTVVRDLSAEGNDLPALLAQLKTACGAGGTLKDGILEIQGDHRERVSDMLNQIGYRLKK